MRIPLAIALPLILAGSLAPLGMGDERAHNDHGHATEETGTEAPAAEHITAAKAWARSTRKKAYVGAAYLEIANASDQADAVIRAESDMAKRIELHTHIKGDDDTVRMEEIPEITLPAEGKTELEPGGVHLMFFGLTQPFETGNTFNVTLHLKSGDSKEVPVIVGGPASKDFAEVLNLIEQIEEVTTPEAPQKEAEEHDHHHDDHKHHDH